jgi:hypothetical protein
MKTPVLFAIYKRPEMTKQVFEVIRKAKPEKLFIAADGPKEGEEEKCKAARAVIDVDWNCDIFYQYQVTNLGGKWGGYSAVNWFFQHVDEGIILEDDDLPDLSFFPFCEVLLQHYREDKRIGTISGDNFQFGNNGILNSYYFSKYLHGWGWATWKRTWDLFDISMADWPEMKQKRWYGDFIDFPREIDFWESTLDRMYAGYPEAWDYQFSYCLWKNQMLNIIPSKNLVANIGMTDSTHAMSPSNPMVNQKRSQMMFPLEHPKMVNRYFKGDRYTAERFYR